MTSDDAHGATPPRIERCTLCIVGSGVAGLNALFVATRYLSKNDRVLLIDRGSRAGGMWNDTYDYVRLHQPHPMFTVGDVSWKLGHPPEYLARKHEVLEHLQHCLGLLRKKVELLEIYRYEYDTHEEVRGEDGLQVRVFCTPLSDDEPPLIVEANQLVKAFGNGIRPNPPLTLSSDNVASMSPDRDDLFGVERQDGNAPVYIIGGGKTAMDTAHALISRFPDREVNLVAGAGTAFTNRDRFFPKGLKRWWGGTSPMLAIADTARRFDGTNEREAHAYFTKTYGISPVPQPRRFMFANLSENEREAIVRGTNEVVSDYLADVVDRDGRTEMIFRSGRTREIERGSWIVNCSGYLFRADHPYEPYLSEQGAVLSIQTRSAVHVLTTFASYFLSHLLWLGKLPHIPLYELDVDDLAHKSKEALPYAGMAMTVHNMAQIVGTVPRHVMEECALDFDRWYPLPRQLTTLLRFQLRRKRDIEHHRRTLDTIRDRFGVRCGPLERSS